MTRIVATAATSLSRPSLPKRQKTGFHGSASITGMVTTIGRRRRIRLYVTEWLQHRGLSDERAAGRLEVSRETIWKWRTQPHRLNTEKLAALASILDIEPEELYRPPNRPSLDAMVKDAPDEVQSMAADIIRRLVGRGN